MSSNCIPVIFSRKTFFRNKREISFPENRSRMKCSPEKAKLKYFSVWKNLLRTSAIFLVLENVYISIEKVAVMFLNVCLFTRQIIFHGWNIFIHKIQALRTNAIPGFFFGNLYLLLKLKNFWSLLISVTLISFSNVEYWDKKKENVKKYENWYVQYNVGILTENKNGPQPNSTEKWRYRKLIY